MNLLFISLFLGVFTQCLGIASDYGKTIPEVIKSRGFEEETHYITSGDGYILTTYRIVNPIAKKVLKTPQPIILSHGLIGSGNDFLVTDAGGHLNETIFQSRGDLSMIDFEVDGNNLGFILANLGYDVWLPQSRGTYYSLNHTKLSPKDKKFWEFSFDEIALEDHPAVIKYIQSETGMTQVGYVGHSQGCTTMFALLAEKPEYSNIVKPFVALGPAVIMNHASGSLHRMFGNVVVQKILLTKGGECFGPNNYTKNIDKYCNGSNLSSTCKSLIFNTVGLNPRTLNTERVLVYIWNDPTGTACWNCAHFGQLISKPKFSKTDFGWFDNYKHYHSHTAPEYKLENINSTNIALFYGPADDTVCLQDVESLKEKLQVPLLMDYEIPYKHWNHLDHIFANTTGRYQNSKIAGLLSKVFN